MAFKASNVLPSTAYDTVRRTAIQLKNNLQAVNARLAASNTDYDYLREIYLLLKRADDQFDTLSATPGISQYAKEMENDPLYDVAAEFTAMQGAISSALAWLDSNVPTNVTIKSPASWDNGTLITNTFTPAQTAGLRTKISDVIAEIT